MAGEWDDLTLGDLGRVVTGKTPLTALARNFGGKIPFVTPSDMDGRKTISTTSRNLTEAGAASVKGSKIPAGSVMVSCIGSDMGKTVIAGRDCVTNQQINSIIVDGRFSNEFVYYNLSMRKDEIRHQAAGGSAQPILNKGDFSRLKIILPTSPHPTRHRACPWHLGRPDRVEPGDERDPGGDGAGLVQELVRGLRPGARQAGRPPARRHGCRNRRPLPRSLRGFRTRPDPEGVFEMMEDNRRESRYLAALRNTLLPKVLSGELQISEAEVRLEASR